MLQDCVWPHFPRVEGFAVEADLAASWGGSQGGYLSLSSSTHNERGAPHQSPTNYPEPRDEWAMI